LLLLGVQIFEQSACFSCAFAAVLVGASAVEIAPFCYGISGVLESVGIKQEKNDV
jgi:hypothetical protein